jgi:DNA primase
LEYPGLALGVDIQNFSELELAGVDVLGGLITYINQNPNTTCGAILEHYRHSEHGAHLAKLAKTVLSVPEIGADMEFKDIIGHLAKLRIQQRADQLLFKSTVTELSADEKDELKYVLSVK